MDRRIEKVEGVNGCEKETKKYRRKKQKRLGKYVFRDLLDSLGKYGNASGDGIQLLNLGLK